MVCFNEVNNEELLLPGALNTDRSKDIGSFIVHHSMFVTQITGHTDPCELLHIHQLHLPSI